MIIILIIYYSGFLRKINIRLKIIGSLSYSVKNTLNSLTSKGFKIKNPKLIYPKSQLDVLALKDQIKKYQDIKTVRVLY